MAKITRYRPRPLLTCLAPRLGVSTSQLCHAVGLPRTKANPSLTAAHYFAMWTTLDGLFPGGLGLDDIKGLVRRPLNAQAIAFSASHDVATGLARVALLKPLSGPGQLTLSGDQAVTVMIKHRGEPPPMTFGRVEVVHLIELMRFYSQHYVRPLKASFPDASKQPHWFADYLSCEVVDGPLSLTLAPEDAHRALIPDMAEPMGPAVSHRLAAESATAATEDRLRAVLTAILPSGRADAGSAARRLGMSKRSLQRRLQKNGASFGTVLDGVRQELALYYLRHDDLRSEEIAILLAFRDPNSFYRAFQAWTGMTPRAARAAQRQVGTGVAPRGPAPIAAFRPPQASTRLA